MFCFYRNKLYVNENDMKSLLLKPPNNGVARLKTINERKGEKLANWQLMKDKHYNLKTQPNQHF